MSDAPFISPRPFHVTDREGRTVSVSSSHVLTIHASSDHGIPEDGTKLSKTVIYIGTDVLFIVEPPEVVRSLFGQALANTVGKAGFYVAEEYAVIPGSWGIRYKFYEETVKVEVPKADAIQIGVAIKRGPPESGLGAARQDDVLSETEETQEDQ